MCDDVGGVMALRIWGVAWCDEFLLIAAVINLCVFVGLWRDCHMSSKQGAEFSVSKGSM